MAGPVLWVLVKARESQQAVNIARRISQAASSRGYGAIFGAAQIGCWDAEERRNLEAIESAFGSDFSVSITDHPLQTSAVETLSQVERLARRRLPKGSPLPGLIHDLSGLEDVARMVFVVSMEPWIAANLPRARVTTAELISRLSSYSSNEADPSREHGGDQILILDNERSSRARNLR